MATADLELFYIAWLVHLAILQIQSFILLWFVWAPFSWKIKYNILIKKKGKQYHVISVQIKEKRKRRIFINIKANTEIKLELPGTHAF